MALPPSTPPPHSSWPHNGVPRPASRWPTVGWLLALAVVAALAIVGWFRPPQDHKAPSAPTFSAQQVDTAKKNVCTAFEKVHNAVTLAHSHVGSSDYNAQLTAAALTNLSLDAGSRYLLTKLAEEPATPADLAAAVRNEANAEQEALIGYLNGLSASDPTMQPAVNASNEATAMTFRLCK